MVTVALITPWLAISGSPMAMISHCRYLKTETVCQEAYLFRPDWIWEILGQLMVWLGSAVTASLGHGSSASEERQGVVSLQLCV